MAKGKPLTQEQLDVVAKLAGTMIDRNVAKEVGCTMFSVFRYRKKHGIPTYKTNERSKLCGVAGSASDSDIVRNTDLSTATIYQYKKENNICKKDTKSSDGAKQYYCSLEDLRSKLKQYAGTMTDPETAQQCGCSIAHVFEYRKKHRIPPVKNGLSKRLTENQKTQLEELLKDSSYSDPHIASIIGCASTNVAQYRKKLGYPKYVKSIIDYDKVKELAGTIPDKDVAKECNCSYAVVFSYRKQNKIPTFRSKRQKCKSY